MVLPSLPDTFDVSSSASETARTSGIDSYVHLHTPNRSADQSVRRNLARTTTPGVQLDDAEPNTCSEARRAALWNKGAAMAGSQLLTFRDCQLYGLQQEPAGFSWSLFQ